MNELDELPVNDARSVLNTLPLQPGKLPIPPKVSVPAEPEPDASLSFGETVWAWINWKIRFQIQQFMGDKPMNNDTKTTLLGAIPTVVLVASWFGLHLSAETLVTVFGAVLTVIGYFTNKPSKPQ